jgi:hypothetical protein
VASLKLTKLVREINRLYVEENILVITTGPPARRLRAELLDPARRLLDPACWLLDPAHRLLDPARRLLDPAIAEEGRGVE